MTCAALLAAFFPGFALGDVDHSRVYEVPAAIASTVPLSHKLLAKACARRHGIRWKVVQ